MLAAVDMGTNSFHMVIVRADSQGRFQIEDVEKEDVRLGSGRWCKISTSFFHALPSFHKILSF